MKRVGVWIALGALCFGACAKSSVVAESELGAACFSGVELEAWDEKFEVFGWCAAEIDRGADGDIDARREHELDENGLLIWRVDETGQETRLERDELGRVTLAEQVDEEGYLLSTERREYDGRSARIERDADGDGEVDILEHKDYGCFPEEDEWPFPGACTTSVDSDADGVIDRVTEFQYEGGLVSSALMTETEREPSRLRYFYDDDGNIVRIETDDDDDGTIDFSYNVEQLDAHTTLIWQGNDGERTHWTETITDDSGRVISEAMFGNGKLIVRNESVWSRDGLAVRVTSTSPENPEQDTITERRYDAAGNVVGVAVDKHPLGSPDECIYVSYECWER